MIERFVCAGSLNVDLTFPVERLPDEHEKLRCAESFLHCGGSAANVAHWLSRLGKPVRMLGCVGDDPFGGLAVAALAQAGVDTRLIQRTGRCLTGMAVIFSNPGSKRMVISGGANADFDPAAVAPEIFAPGVHLHVATSLNHLALPLIRQAKERGATVSCDLDQLPETGMIPHLDLVFVNHTELRRGTGGQDPRPMRQRLPGDAVLIVTQGARGAMALDGRGECSCPAFPTTLIDRSGGGDAFAAGYLHAHASGCPPQECLRLGLALAAQVIAATGSRPSVDVAKVENDARFG